MSTSPRQTRTSIVAQLPTHPLSLQDDTCTNLKCPFRQAIRDEELRCSRLGAANQVLRDAQQFLLAKCEASAEHSNMLGFELDALRKEREELLASIRTERIHFDEQREDMNRRWEHISSTEEALASTRRQLMLSQQESSLLKDQLCSLQDAVNKLTERLAHQHRQRTPEKRLVAAPTQAVRSEDRPESAGRRGTTPPRARATYDSFGRSNSPIASKRTGTLFVNPSAQLPPNFYHSPQHDQSSRQAPQRTQSPQDVERNESEPRPQIGWEPESEQGNAIDAAPSEASMHHTPDGRRREETQHIWHQMSISPAALPSPLTEYTRSMKAALERADYVSAGLSAVLPRLSGRSQSSGEERRTASFNAATTPKSAFMKDYETYIRSHPLVALGDEVEVQQQHQQQHRGDHDDGNSTSYAPAFEAQLVSAAAPHVQSTNTGERSPLLARASDPYARFDVDAAGVSATMALRKFRDSTQFAYGPSLVPTYQPMSTTRDRENALDDDKSEGSSSPPPPPPQEADDLDSPPAPRQVVTPSLDAPRRSQLLPATRGSAVTQATATNATLDLLGLPQFRSSGAASATTPRGNFGRPSQLAGDRGAVTTVNRRLRDSEAPSFDEQ